MRNLRRIMMLLAILLFVSGCDSDEPGSKKPDKNPPHQGELDFDYDKIAPHPRLLLSKSEEANLKSTIASNPELKNIHDHILAQSNTMLNQGAVVYKKTGKRLLAVSREALKRIFFLSYSYRMTGDVKYLNRAETELNAVCDFPDWNPTHFLDVGEMTMAVAIGYDWLHDNLKDETKKKIRKTINNYAFTASDNHSSSFKRTNNWNQVCNAGLIYGALALFEDDETESIKRLERSVKSNVLALGSYAPDGNYPEGPSYWAYGTGFQVMLIAALESALGSDGGLSSQPGFLKTAEYMLFASGPNDLFFNYSDCAERRYSNISVFWFAQKTNDPNLLFLEKQQLAANKYLNNLSDEIRLLPAMLTFVQKINYSSISAPMKKVWSGEGETPVVMVRTDWENNMESEYLGVKGGSASASHAHMDAGTFVYDSKGLRWATDLGLQSYITLEEKGIDLWNMNQGSQRWRVFRLNNHNHNTISVNGKEHRVNGKATLMEVYDSPTEKGGKIDMTEVFQDNLKRSIRKVVLKDDSYLEVTDEIEMNNREARIRWTMVTRATVTINAGENTVELTQGGKKKLMNFSADNPLELKTWNSADPGTDYDAKNPGTIMVGFEATVPAEKNVTFRVTIKDKP